MSRSRTWIWGVLGALLGIAAAVVVLATAAAGRGEPGTGVPRLVSESEGAITEIAMHYVPHGSAVVRDTYADFLGALGDDVRINFVVADDLSEAQRQALLEWLGRIRRTLPARVHLVPSPGPITTWSKDRALVTQPVPDGAAWLVAPAEPGPDWKERHGDWLTVESLARASGGRFERRVAPFDFDAGDFAIANGRIIVDTNLVEKNRHRGITDAASLARRLEAWFEAPVVVLGSSPGDTPRHHLSMSMTPLYDDVVLVGDPLTARGLVGEGFRPGPRSTETRQPLQADFSEATLRRFETVAAELRRHGFRVERVPNVPLEDKTYLTYTNGEYETRDGRRIAYVPAYGIEELDRAARLVYSRLGWEVRPIRVSRVYPLHGTIGCLVNVLARRSAVDERR